MKVVVLVSRKTVLRSSLLAAFFGCAGQVATAQAQEVLLYDGTEGRGGASTNGVCTEYGYQDSAERVFRGELAQRFEVRPTDPLCQGQYRSELIGNGLQPEVDYWFGFAIMIPSRIRLDETFMFWQVFARPDECEPYRASPMALILERDEIVIRRAYDERACSPDTLEADPIRRVDRVTTYLGRDRWHEVVIHFRIDPRLDGDGVFEVWHNHVLSYRYRGPLGFEDERGHFIKWGDFTFDSPPPGTNVHWMDEVRLVQGGEYASVSPSGRPATGERAPGLECDELFSALDGYALCAADDRECELVTTTGSMSCADVCDGEETTCVRAYAADGGTCGSRAEEAGCDAPATSHRCVCARTSVANLDAGPALDDAGSAPAVDAGLDAGGLDAGSVPEDPRGCAVAQGGLRYGGWLCAMLLGMGVTCRTRRRGP